MSDEQAEKELARKVLAHATTPPTKRQAAWEEFHRDMAANPEALKLMRWKPRAP